MNTISFQNLTKRFGPVLAVDDLSFDALPGRVTGLLGPDGSGKTTTLRILLGLAAPTSGTATIAGWPYRQLPDRLRRVGAALDTNTFHPGRSAAQHLQIITTAADLPPRRVGEVLDLAGLSDVADRKVGGYSPGIRQRLSLAGALLGNPRVLVLDEPLNGARPRRHRRDPRPAALPGRRRPDRADHQPAAQRTRPDRRRRGRPVPRAARGPDHPVRAVLRPRPPQPGHCRMIITIGPPPSGSPWSFSPPRTSPPNPSPASTCPPASRSASMAAGSPTSR